MTQPPRTTESISRNHEAIRDIMHRIRDLTVPDRATLAVGLIGHLATVMNRSQITKLLGELQEEAKRAQEEPPSRQRDLAARTPAPQSQESDRSDRPDARAAAGRGESAPRGRVGQAGRGEFRSGELV